MRVRATFVAFGCWWWATIRPTDASWRPSLNVKQAVVVNVKKDDTINNGARRSGRAKTTTTTTNATALRRMLVGGVSRGLAQAALYPVDAMRTLAQTRDGRTLADLGAKTLTKGCAQTSSFALFQGALQFGIFSVVRHDLGAGPLTASALGAAGSCLVSVPQEVIKQRLVTGVYGSFREAVSSIQRRDGVRGFYDAWRPTVMRNVPFVVVTFTAMDVMKRRLLSTRTTTDGERRTELSVAENVCVGMSSAMLGGIVTHPVDFVKTRMMTQAASASIPYESVADCVRTVLRTEGPAKFYSGFPQRSVYMCGLWGITFALNGKFNEMMDANRDETPNGAAR